VPQDTTLTPRLFESIRLEDGELPLLEYHQERINRSRRSLYTRKPVLKLSKLLPKYELPQEGIYKLRISYGADAQDVSWTPYTLRKITSLRIVKHDELLYQHKYHNRDRIDRLWEQRGQADDILIVQHGYLTDTSYHNIALYDGNKWYTPSWPLLRGTRRAALLDAGTIHPTLIRERDLHHFQKIRLFNALITWEEAPEVEIGRVRP
jgi:4-amino-4-deoxychorismate lyase